MGFCDIFTNNPLPPRGDCLGFESWLGQLFGILIDMDNVKCITQDDEPTDQEFDTLWFPCLVPECALAVWCNTAGSCTIYTNSPGTWVPIGGATSCGCTYVYEEDDTTPPACDSNAEVTVALEIARLEAVTGGTPTQDTVVYWGTNDTVAGTPTDWDTYSYDTTTGIWSCVVPASSGAIVQWDYLYAYQASPLNARGAPDTPSDWDYVFTDATRSTQMNVTLANKIQQNSFVLALFVVNDYNRSALAVTGRDGNVTLKREDGSFALDTDLGYFHQNAGGTRPRLLPSIVPQLSASTNLISSHAVDEEAGGGRSTMGFGIEYDQLAVGTPISVSLMGHTVCGADDYTDGARCVLEDRWLFVFEISTS